MPTHSPNPTIAPVAVPDVAVWLKIADRHWSAGTVTPDEFAAHIRHPADDASDWRMAPSEKPGHPRSIRVSNNGWGSPSDHRPGPPAPL
ncbi:MAG TPA: hypothetical protein VGL78_18115 [Solirubrobacteraceae bacterium]